MRGVISFAGWKEEEPGGAGMVEPTRMEILKLKQMLTADDKWMRKNAAWVFGNNPGHAKKALESLLIALDDEDPYVRLWSAKALGELGPEAAPALEKLERLAKEDPYDGQFMMIIFPVRHMAREAIGKIKSKN
jgi:HEAT repeat protein